jgi:type III pantothenate kinase
MECTMKCDTLVLSIDIGNTNIDIGLIDIRTCACPCHVKIAVTADDAKLDTELNLLFSRYSTSSECLAAIASVNPSQTDRMICALNRIHCTNISILRAYESLPIGIDYEKPQSLGADRVADALGAWKRYPGRNCIIIDAGTAIKVDCLTANGYFGGGVIFPGVSLQARALSSGTAQLPDLDMRSPQIQLPGKSTAQCITGGILYGIAGSVSGFVAYFSKHFNNDCKVLATGGGWHLISSIVDFEYGSEPDLALLGLAVYSTYAQK